MPRLWPTRDLPEFPQKRLAMNLHVTSENIEELRASEYALSQVESELGELVSEPFPVHPGVEASENELMNWWSARNLREKRVEALLSKRSTAAGKILRLLAQL